MKIIFLLILLPVAFACYTPTDAEQITESVNFCSDTFDAPNGIYLTTSGIVVDCGTAIIRGDKGESNAGIILVNVNNVTLRNCNVATFENGIMLKNVSFSTIERNNLLKNNVGIRLFDSFENTIIKNNDKSLVRSVSAINSKFNLVSLGNKGVEEGFCDVNACNANTLPDPCVSGDFYCSPNCMNLDDDCKKPIMVEKPKVKSADDIIKEFEAEIVEKDELIAEITPKKDKNVPLTTQIVIYIAAYLLGLICIQFSLHKKR